MISPILEMSILARQMPDVVSLGWGVPSFQTPEHIREAAARCLLENADVGKYTHIRGLPELRAAIAGKMAREWEVHLDPEREVLVTVGAQQALFSALLTIADPGDEILLASPGFSAHAEQVILAGATPVYFGLAEEDRWELRADCIERILSPRTKAILLNYPSNPTGALFDGAELQRIAELALERGLFIILDATYAFLCYEGNRPFNLFTVPGLRQRLLGCFSFSKEYAMTGWRVGYLCAEASLVEEVLKVHDASVVAAPRLSQMAALAALLGSQDCVREFRRILQRRRDLMCSRLDRLSGVFRYIEPEGSYYLFPRILDPSLDSSELALALLHQARVVTVPGDAFGPSGKGYLRLCFAGTDEEIEEAFDRLERFF